MVWILVGMVLLVLVFVGRYVIYRQKCRWESRHNGGDMVTCRPFKCFYGLHQWYLDAAQFTAVSRCNYCDATQNALALRRLEYERGLWDKEAKVRGISFKDSKKLIAIKLSEWDRQQELEQVVRDRGAA